MEIPLKRKINYLTERSENTREALLASEIGKATKTQPRKGCTERHRTTEKENQI